MKRKHVTTSKGTFDCLLHGKNISHNTKDCKMIKATVDDAKKNKQTKSKKAKKAKDEESPDTESEAESTAQAVSVRYKERYLKACAQRSLCRRYVTQSFEAQLLCNCDERSMT